MRLCYGGRDLEDGETVERYGMRNGATVFGLLRLLGGAISTGSAVVVDETVPPRTEEPPPASAPAIETTASPLTRRRVVVPQGKGAEGRKKGGGETFGRSASGGSRAGGDKAVRGRRVRVARKEERKDDKKGVSKEAEEDEPAREEEYVEDPEEMEEGAVLVDPVRDFVQIREGLRQRGAKITQAARPDLDQEGREAYEAAPMRLKLGVGGGLLEGHFFDVPGTARPSAPLEAAVAETAIEVFQQRTAEAPDVDTTVGNEDDSGRPGDQERQAEGGGGAEKLNKSDLEGGAGEKKRRKSFSQSSNRRKSVSSAQPTPGLEARRYRQPRAVPEPAVIAAPAKAKKSRRALDMMLMEEKKKTIIPRRRKVAEKEGGGSDQEELTLTEQLVAPGLAPPWPIVPACRSSMMACRSSNKAIRIKRLKFISGSDLIGRIQESQKTYTCVWKHSPGATYCRDFCFTHYISQLPAEKCWYVRRHRIVTIPNPNAGSARDYPIASQPLRNECAEKRGQAPCVRKTCIACKAAGRKYERPFGLVFDEHGRFLPKDSQEPDKELEQLMRGEFSPLGVRSPTSPTARFAMRGLKDKDVQDAKGWRKIQIQQRLNKSGARHSDKLRDFDITDVPVHQAMAGTIPSATKGMGTERDRNGICCDAWPRIGKLDGDICYPLQDKMNDPNIRDFYGPLHVFQMRRGKWPSDPIKPQDRLKAIMGEQPKPQFPATWHKPVSS